MTFACRDFVDLDTMITLDRDVTLDIRRDPDVFGKVKFGLWNPETETFIGGVKLEIAGQTVTTDGDGQVSMFVPLEQQRKTYQVKAPFRLYNDMITMPCGESDVIEKL